MYVNLSHFKLDGALNVATVTYSLLYKFIQRHTVSHHLSKNYNPLKFSDDRIGDGFIFIDLGKALKSAKESSKVSKSVEPNNGRRKFCYYYRYNSTQTST